MAFVMRMPVAARSACIHSFRPALLASYHPSIPTRDGDDATADKAIATTQLKTSFLTDEFQSKAYTENLDMTFAGAMEPFRPDNWEELLQRAAESYPERAGPRRNNRKERERNRRWVIMQQHKMAKRQRIAAHEKKQSKVKRELYKMREAYATYGYPPAVEYAEKVATVEALKSVGLGGRLGAAYFGPLFRDRTFDPNRRVKEE